MTISRTREVLRSTRLTLRFVAGVLLYALGTLIVFFTSNPRARLSPLELTDADLSHPIEPGSGEPLPHCLDFPPGWRVKNYGPSERRASGAPTHLAPYGERMDEIDA